MTRTKIGRKRKIFISQGLQKILKCVDSPRTPLAVHPCSSASSSFPRFRAHLIVSFLPTSSDKLLLLRALSRLHETSPSPGRRRQLQNLLVLIKLCSSACSSSFSLCFKKAPKRSRETRMGPSRLARCSSSFRGSLSSIPGSAVSASPHYSTLSRHSSRLNHFSVSLIRSTLLSMAQCENSNVSTLHDTTIIIPNVHKFSRFSVE